VQVCGSLRRPVPRFILAAATLLLTTALACHAPSAGAQPIGPQGAPDLTIGTAKFPDEDAIILRWEQHWTLDKDGTVHRRDHQWVKLLNSRPIGRFGDPRIDFADGEDKLINHAARTHLPSGKVLPVPDYSFNPVGPDDVAGWPQYARWQQQVICFGGIEDGAVLELDYEVVTPPRVMPWIDADVRLHDDYPTVERIVSVTVPEGTPLHHQLDRVDRQHADFKESKAGGSVTFHWTFANLPGARGEEQSPVWQQRCGRLRFTTARDASTWASTMLQRVEAAGQPDDAIKKFGESTTEGEADTAQRVRKVAKKLQDSFNLINSPKAMRGLECRNAADVFRANYGNPLESGAVWVAALRSLGLSVTPVIGLDANLWHESDTVAPTESAFAGVVLVVDLPDGPLYVHPEQGVFKSPGKWGRHWLLRVDKAGTLQRTYVYARGEKEPGRIQIAGKIVVDPKGEATGELRFFATGQFFDPSALETTDGQKDFVTKLVGRVLSDFNVPGYSVVALSDEEFRATANVASKGALLTLEKTNVLRFGDGPAFLPDVPMPLARSYRNTDVQLAGRFSENIDLTIQLPDKWKPAILQGTMAPTKDRWGTTAQTVEVTDKNVRLRRDVAITADKLSPGDFAKVREAINDLRATRSLLLGVGKPSPD
jgi:hypothetical protein